MNGSRLVAFCLAALLLWLPSVAAAKPASTPASAETAIRATLSRWYEELAKRDEGRLWDVVSPGFIDSTPPSYHADTKSRSLGPLVHVSLPAQALKFAWEVESVRRDSTFARVQVWERGYFYAFAAQSSYERAASTTFILERREKDGRWLIAAHQSGSYGIPPNKVTSPMPDLRTYFYANEGRSRDPAEDARTAAQPQ